MEIVKNCRKSNYVSYMKRQMGTPEATSFGTGTETCATESVKTFILNNIFSLDTSK